VLATGDVLVQQAQLQNQQLVILTLCSRYLSDVTLYLALSQSQFHCLNQS